MNFKTLALATLATISAGAAAVTVVDLDDVSFKAEEIRGSLFAASATSTSSTVRQDAPTDSAITVPVKPVERIAVSNAQTVQRTFGSFPAPSIFPITQPTLSGSAFPWFALQQERSRPRRLAVNVPYWVPHKKQIVIPNARIDGQYHEGINLELQPDGTFKQLYTSTPMNKADISAANYRAGVLTLTTLMVGDIRFSNVRFELRPNGNLEIVDAYFPNEVKRSSYENYNNISLAPTKLPVVRGKYTFAQQSWARAFGDFTQRGEISVFDTAIQWYGSPNKKEPAVYAFFSKVRGEWVDVTSSLVVRDPNTGNLPQLCAHPRQSAVNDYNGDAIPDIFVACFGTESPEVPYNQRGENSFMFLSRLDGMYEVKPFVHPRVRYAHSVTSYDFDGRGFADILVADMDFNNQSHKMPVTYFENESGNFTVRDDKIPFVRNLSMFNVEIFEMGNQLYMYGAGPDLEYYGAPHGINASFYRVSRDGQFQNTAAFTVPTLESQQILQCKTCYNHNLSMTVHDGKAYILKVTPEYTNYAIVEYDFSTKSAEYVHIHDGSIMRQWSPNKAEVPMCEGIGTTWVDYIRVHDNKIVTDAACTSPNVKLN